MTRPSPMTVEVAPPPRLVPRWFFVRRMQVLFFSVVLATAQGLLILIVIGAITGHPPPGPDFWLDRHAQTARGRITSLRFLSHIHMGNRSPWEVGLEFRTDSGRIVRTKGYTFDDVGIEVDAPVDVQYSPDHPQWARPDGGMASTFPYWLYPIVGAPLIVGLVLLLVLWRNVARERRLLELGQAAPAEVTHVQRRKYIHFGRKNPFDVHYRLREPSGQETPGKDRTYLYDWAESLQPGDTVWVIHDPVDPRRSVLWIEQPQDAHP